LSRREGMGLAQASTKDITVRSGLAASRTNRVLDPYLVFEGSNRSAGR
jgi:hypothetical protein